MAIGVCISLGMIEALFVPAYNLTRVSKKKPVLKLLVENRGHVSYCTEAKMASDLSGVIYNSASQRALREASDMDG